MKKNSFRILRHPADLKIKIRGKNKKEIISGAMSAMFVSAGFSGKGKVIKREIIVKAPDFASLLVSFLSHVLCLSDLYKEVYSRLEPLKIDEKRVKGTLWGQKISKQDLIIKGATFHDLKIKEDKNKHLCATILFDT